MSFGTERSMLTRPSLDWVWPLRPPVALAVVVKSGLILSIIHLLPVGAPEWGRLEADASHVFVSNLLTNPEKPGLGLVIGKQRGTRPTVDHLAAIEHRD